MTLYHGGRARLRAGGLIKRGHRPNPWGDHAGPAPFVYCTTDLGTAEAYAEEVRRTGRRAYVYEVEPTGDLIPDRNEADFKTRDPLIVVERIPAGVDRPSRG